MIRKTLILMGSIALAAVMTVTACTTGTTTAIETESRKALKEEITTAPHQVNVGSLWDSELFDEERFMMNIRLNQAERREAKRLSRSFTVHMQKSELLMHYLLSELKKRNLPIELAAVPLLESGFNPRAVSPAGAQGLWQFTRPTGKTLGLQRSRGYDDFYDIIKSTDASLRFLEHLYNEFGSWDIALVAYNQGEYGIKKAVSRVRGRGAKYVSVKNLPISGHARQYLRHFRIYAELIRNPKDYGAKLPEIKNRPAFKSINVAGKISSMREVANITGANIKDLKHLNAGYTSDRISNARHQVLLVPIENAHALESAIGIAK